MSAAPNAIDPSPDSGVFSMLVCPRDHRELVHESNYLLCPKGHRYAVVDGVPILLLPEMNQTHIEGSRSLAVAEAPEAAQLPQFNIVPGEIDPFVQNSISATNGSLYRHMVGKLTEYPIPELKLPDGNGKLFLEIGCSWGRWCIAAARKGYRVVGIDPSLKGIRAARRVARQLGIQADYLVADGRALPFADGALDCAFSYSVLQHVSKDDVRSTLREIGRVLCPEGTCMVQLGNKFGVRCLYHQARRGFREAHSFEVRYWGPGEMLSAFRREIGPARLMVDGYFSLNPQISDVRFFPPFYRAIVYASEALRRVSTVFPPLAYLADSLYVTATRSRQDRGPACRDKRPG